MVKRANTKNMGNLLRKTVLKGIMECKFLVKTLQFYIYSEYSIKECLSGLLRIPQQAAAFHHNVLKRAP